MKLLKKSKKHRIYTQSALTMSMILLTVTKFGAVYLGIGVTILASKGN